MRRQIWAMWAVGGLLAALLAGGCSEQPPPGQAADAGQRLPGATSPPAAAPPAARPAPVPAAQPPLDQGQQLTADVSDLSGLISDLGGQQTAAGLAFTFNADVLFDFDKADLKPVAQPTLEKLAQVVQQAAKSRIVISGYTDAKGDAAYNLGLSRRRAQAIADWLRAHQAGAPGQTQVNGYGEANPVAPNVKPDGSDDPAGRQQNRRVEVLIS